MTQVNKSNKTSLSKEDREFRELAWAAGIVLAMGVLAELLPILTSYIESLP